MLTFSENQNAVTAEQQTAVAMPSVPPGVWPLRFLRSPKRGLHQGFLSLADQAVASITNFVTGIIIARSASKEEFGLYMLGFSLLLLLADLQTSLIATPYMVYAPRLSGKERVEYTGSTLLHQGAFGLIASCLLGIAASVAHFGVGPQGLSPVLAALAAMGSFLMLREFVRRLCFSLLKLSSVFLFDVCIGVAQVSTLLVLAHLKIISASGSYWVIGAICGAAAALWLLVNRRDFSVNISRAIADAKRNWLFGKWVFASGLLWTCSTNLYPWLLAFFHGAAASGVFAACLGVVSASNPALLGIQNFLGPKIAHEFATKGRTALRRLVLRISGTLLLPVSVLSVVLIFWGDRLIAMLYGNRYAGNGPVIAILAVNLLVTAVVFSFSRALLAIERADLDFYFNAAAIAIMLTLGVWLVRKHGPLGAALGLLGANLITAVTRATICLRLMGETPAQRVSFP